MLIFSNKNIKYVFIHIPKNSGKYLRDKIIANKNNKIIKSYWGYEGNLDLAHIPYTKKNDFIKFYAYFFAYTRCPYNRFISAYFYINPENSVDDFKSFIKTELITYEFNMDYDCNIIHYYPQYLFVCDNTMNIKKNIKISKLENLENPRKYNLPDFFDNECIHIINKIYNNDFLFFDYNVLDADVF